MTLKIGIGLFICMIIHTACSSSNTIDISNPKEGELISKIDLTWGIEKVFILDSLTAPKIRYAQVVDDGTTRQYTFLNGSNNTIYFYDYDSSKFLKKIELPQTGIDAINIPTGYYIKSIDSIFVYDKSTLRLLLINSRGDVLDKVSLIGDKNVRKDPFYQTYPQYDPQASKPILATGNEIIFTGQMMESLPEMSLDIFKFIAHINLKSLKVSYTHRYPPELYGRNSNWEGQVLTEVSPELGPSGEILLSFPVSHDVYVTDGAGETIRSVYAGGNKAGTISSIDMKPQDTPHDVMITHFVRNDEYGAIKYDSYRKLYYRFLRRGIRDASQDTPINQKPVDVIVFNDKFEYLGEVTLGNMKNWNVANVLVTREGLNIEYVNDVLDEDKMIIKTLTFKMNL